MRDNRDSRWAGARFASWSHPTRWATPLLLGITLLAALLRLWQAGESLWIDELHTSWVVSGTLSEVMPRAAMGNQSPLYFWGLWLVVQVAGQSEWTLRLTSLAAGIVLPAAVYWLVREYSGRPCRAEGGGMDAPSVVAALFAALFVAIDPACIFYAQEARPYAWVMLLAVIEMLLLRRVIEMPTIAWRMALVTNSLVLFYLHYTTAIFLVGIVTLLPLLVRVTKSAYRHKHLLLDLLLAAGLAAPGVMQMNEIWQRRANWAAFLNQPGWEELLTKVPFAGLALAGTVLVAAVQLLPRSQALPENGLTRGSASLANEAGRPPSVLWYAVLVASILIPLFLSWLVTFLDAARIYHLRYLVALVPLAAAAACAATVWLRWPSVQLVLLAAVALWHLHSGDMLQQWAKDGRFLNARNEDWRGAIAYLNTQKMTEMTNIVVEPDLIEGKDFLTHSKEDVDYVSFPVNGLYRIRHEQTFPRLSWTEIFVEVHFAQPGYPAHEPLWYLIRGPEPTTAELLEQLSDFSGRTTSFHAVEERAFGRVRVLCIAREGGSSANGQPGE